MQLYQIATSFTVQGLFPEEDPTINVEVSLKRYVWQLSEAIHAVYPLAQIAITQLHDTPCAAEPSVHTVFVMAAGDEWNKSPAKPGLAVRTKVLSLYAELNAARERWVIHFEEE